ncbi:hypothetical protein QQP08_018429 [Theobroma cacao]|nr:hypothetical protein QQP08_018429 [Theobroma cacao]
MDNYDEIQPLQIRTMVKFKVSEGLELHFPFQRCYSKYLPSRRGPIRAATSFKVENGHPTSPGNTKIAKQLTNNIRQILNFTVISISSHSIRNEELKYHCQTSTLRSNPIKSTVRLRQMTLKAPRKRHLANHQHASSVPQSSAIDSNLELEPESEVDLEQYQVQFEAQALEP